MKRAIRRILLTLLLLIVAGGTALYLSLGRVLRQAVEGHTTAALNLRTTVGAVSVSPLKGRVHFKDFTIASPAGFTTPDMIVLPDSDVDATLGELRSQPVYIPSITLNHPRLVVETNGTMLNLKRMVELLPHQPSSIRLVIDEVIVTDATVVLRPGLLGLQQEVDVPVPTFHLKNIGRAGERDDGAAEGVPIKDAVTRLVKALVANASDSETMPAHLRAMLKGDVFEIGAEVERQLLGLLYGRAAGGAPSTRPAEAAR